MRTEDDYRTVAALVDEGVSDYEIARQVGIPRSTVQNWRLKGRPRGLRVRAGSWQPSRRSYSYLLGAYLGDGVIWAHLPPRLATRDHT